MGKALEIIAGAATAPGATLTGLTMASGDSLTVRKDVSASLPIIISCWAKNQAAGLFQLLGPGLHDTTRGFRNRVTIGDPEPFIPFGYKQPIPALETLSAQISGSAVAGDLEMAALLIAYEDLQGIQARFISPDDVKARTEDLVTVEATITTTTGPNWTGSETLTSESDLLKGDRDYALLGMDVGVLCNAVALRGSDTGNLRVGLPGNATDKWLTCGWFIHLSLALGQPWIPVINAANKNNTFIEAQQDENAAAVPISLIFALLTEA